MSKKLKLTLNIGTHDAQRLQLESVKEGEVVTVEDAAADEMLRRGWGVEPGSEPAKVAAAEVDIDSMTKEELKAHADALGIEGVTMAQAKDDMVRTIRKASRNR